MSDNLFPITATECSTLSTLAVIFSTPQPEVPALNERRVSVMYDDASEEDDGEDDDDNEEGQNVDPEEAKSYEVSYILDS